MLKKALTSTLKGFINFCEQHNLRYYAAFGTAIGAVRHHGIIPWDDDIDVYMPREDYNKFLSLRGTLENSEYEIVDIENKGYYLERQINEFEYKKHYGGKGLNNLVPIKLERYFMDTNLFSKKSAISEFKRCSDGKLLEIYELENYFTDMFGSEVWEYYILQVKGIIHRVKQEVGFTVNRELNPKNLSYLKSTLKEIFREICMYFTSFYIIVPTTIVFWFSKICNYCNFICFR